MKKINTKITLTKTFLFILPVLLAWLVLLYTKINSPVLKVIDKKHPFYFVTYSDHELQGNSEASAKMVNDTLVFNYQLREGYAWPYAGICFVPPKGSLKILKEPNYIRLRLTSRKAKVIPITINEAIPGYSDTVLYKNFRVWTYNLKVHPQKKEYQIPFSDFEVPLGWEKEHPSIHKPFPDFDTQRIQNICIQNCILLGNNQMVEIKIASINIERDYQKWIWSLLIGTGIWMIAGLILLLKSRNKAAIFIPYVATETKSENPNEWNRIQSYISVHYMEELDMDLLEKELGIARHKIASLIKENTSLLFKQYLNQIRVAEAKRLLLKTDLPIGELADKVGFGHISNFNRVFKEYTGQSPSDLRKDLNHKS